MASLGSRWRAPLVLVMAGRRSPSVLLSLRVCIYTDMYTYTSRQAVVPCFLSLSVSPSSFLPFFLLRRGSHRRSPKGSTRRSADGLPNDHPTDHQTDTNRSPKRPPDGHPKDHPTYHQTVPRDLTQQMTTRPFKRPPRKPLNGRPKDHPTDQSKVHPEYHTKDHRTHHRHSGHKFDPKRDLILIKSMTQGSIQDEVTFDQNSDPKFNPKWDLIWIKILTPSLIPNGTSSGSEC